VCREIVGPALLRLPPALDAQAAALGARGLSIDPSSESRVREADALLRQRPVPLDEATRAVEQYEAAVVAQSALQRG
jgi:hypothetical protein